MNEEITQNLRNVEESVGELRREVSLFKNSYDSYVNRQSQLQYPIDVKSKDIIRDSAPFAISKHFENASAATAANYGIVFIANSPAVVLGVSLRYNTASTSGTLNVERLQGTEALGAGDTLLTSTISMSATANTTYDGTLKNTDAIFLRDGDALALIGAGTLTSLVGLCVTIKMKWI